MRVTLRHAVLASLMTLACWLLADLVNVYISHALLQVAPPKPVIDQAAASLAAVASSPDATQMVKSVLSSGVFVVPVNVSILDPEKQQAAPPPPPLDFTGKLKLLGTAIGYGLPPAAAIEDQKDHRQALYFLHEAVGEFGELVEVHKDGVSISQGDRRGFLPLVLGESVPVNPSSAPPQAPVQSPAGRIIVDRRMLKESFSDLPKLLSQSQARPYYHYLNGRLDGWQMLNIQPNSVLSKLSIEPGDVIQQVNGVPVQNPSTLLAFFQQIKEERLVKLNILRNSNQMILIYEIR